jgi:hypothetical protein
MPPMQLLYGASTTPEIPDLSYLEVCSCPFPDSFSPRNRLSNDNPKVLGAGSLPLFHGLQKELQLLRLLRKIKRAFTFRSSGPSSNAVLSLVQQFRSARTGTPILPMGAESMMEPMWDYSF